MHLTDRSRYALGLSKCLMARYLKYHSFGGYGIEKVGTSVPLATGLHVHLALELILRAHKDHPVTEDEARECVATAISEYKKSVVSRGFSAEGDNHDQAWLIQEQAALIEGLVWAWYFTMYPLVQERFEIVAVEEEIEIAYGADNILFMSRPDFVARDKKTGELGIHDFKTSAVIDDNWVQSWKDSVQMAVGTLAAERKYGEKVTHYYIHGLLKGLRKSEYNREKKAYEGPRRQASSLVYAYHREANLPLVKEDWSAAWIRTKDYVKTPTWDFPGGTEGWVRSQPASELYKHCVLAGPYLRQDYLIQQYLRAIPEHEGFWKSINEEFKLDKEAFQAAWPKTTFQEELDRAIPRSYSCNDFYGSRCEFYDLCFKNPGWQDPYILGYKDRKPHHTQEVDQLAKGVGCIQ